MQVVLAEPGVIGQRLQAGRRFRLVDQATELGDQRRLALGERSPVGLATLAWPKTGPLGFGSRGMEGHMLRPRRACAAGRPAIDARRRYRVEKLPAGRLIT